MPQLSGCQLQLQQLRETSPSEDTEEQVLQRLTIPPDSFGKVVKEKLRSNRIYRPRPKSGSADTIIKQENFVLEIQDKSGLAAPLDWATVCKEVGSLDGMRL